MSRDTLGKFFRRVVLATLPLACACGSQTGFCQGRPTPENIVVDGGFSDGSLVTDTDLGYTELDPAVRAQLCATWCKPSLWNCSVADAGAGVVTCAPGNCVGRRPAMLREVGAGAADDMGGWLARAAHLEAASVPAFRTLAEELRAHAAPTALIAACERAALDEVRHARLTTRLARRHGHIPPPVELGAAAPRGLAEIALDNAVEGCVRETFGALTAVWQTHTATNGEVRALAEAIAPDETRHAELAWAIAGHLEPRLCAESRRQIAVARHRALAELAVQHAGSNGSPWHRAAGLPDSATAQVLIAALAEEVTRREAALS